MFGISMWELGVIMVVALILLGPRQLVETARVLGRWYREIQRMTSEIRGAIDLDSVASPPREPHYDSLPKVPAAPVPPKNQDLVPPPGEKIGPDFYAELLESSREEEKNVKVEESKKEDLPSEPPESKDKK